MDTTRDIEQIVTRRQGVWDAPPRKVPTIFSVDGPLLGNGDTGVVIGGPADALKVWLAKTDLWKARDHYLNGSICPLGWIEIVTDAAPADSYHLEQDLYSAEARGEFRRNGNPGSRLALRAWVQADENLVVLELEAFGEPLAVDVVLHVMDGNGSETATGTLPGMPWSPGGQWATRAFRAPDLLWPTEAAAAMRVLHRGRVDIPRRGPLGWPEERFWLTPEYPVVVVCALATNHDRADYLEHARARVAGITFQETDALRAAHRKWWQDFWSRSLIEIGDPVLEGFWYGAQYIMASCSRNRHFPPGLYGNFITTDRTGWGSDYHLNYNYQAAWWGVFSSNHVELADPYDAPLLAYLPRGRQNARDLLGCRGVYYEVGLGPKGLGTTRGWFLGQKSIASYAAVNMVMRWAYTRDVDYARDTAYPFLREVGDFWEDYLRFENGRYMDYDDAIHEDNVARDLNPLLSLGLIRMVFGGLLELSAVLGADRERREKWQHILDHLSPYPTQQRDGMTVFRYTEQGMAWYEFNSLGEQHIFPAGDVGLGSDPALLQIARNTVAAQARWEDGNAFPTFYTAAVRVGHDPGEILRNLRDQVIKYGMPNRYVAYGGGGIETCGASEAINEMLLQSHEGVLRLFPVWPADRPARFARLRAVGAFLVSAAWRDGAARDVSITSEKGQPCTLDNPWPGRAATLCRPGQPAETLLGDRFTFPTTAGETLSLAPGDGAGCDGAGCALDFCAATRATPLPPGPPSSC